MEGNQKLNYPRNDDSPEFNLDYTDESISEKKYFDLKYFQFWNTYLKVLPKLKCECIVVKFPTRLVKFELFLQGLRTFPTMLS